MKLNIQDIEYNGWDNRYKFVVDNLKRNIPFAYARFNDGEIGGICNENYIAARGDQPISSTLQVKLTQCIKHKQKNYWIGMPCSLCYPQYYHIAEQLVREYEYKTSAVVLTNRNWIQWLKECPTTLSNKKIFWIGGEDQEVKNLKQFFNVDLHKLYPRRNTWKYYQQIFEECFETSKEYNVTFISLGPIARVLACEWFYANPDTTYIDIGSTFDPFTRNVWHNCHKGWGGGFNKTKRCNECN